MENWEFFLQKIGEENWLRIETAAPEFPTGRYVIAARAAHHAQESIEVEVREQDSKTRTQQNSCQLDPEGFGILLPEIELTPGVWEIQCRSDLLSELMGESWEITLTLRITLDLEKSPLRVNPEESSGEDLNQLRSRLIDDADQILQEVVTELFPSSSTFPAYSPEKVKDYSLQIDQDILITQTNKPIILSGKISTQKQPPHPKLRLHLTLRDPRTGNLVAELFPRLRDQPFPLTFCYSLTVPSPCDSYLLQGEITLLESNPEQPEAILDSQPFTVSANWEKLQPFLVGVITTATVSHPPAPLSPLSSDQRELTDESSQRWRGVIPPKLKKKGDNKKKSPPTLPKLPNSTKGKPKEYVWSKPDQDTETASEWELLPELAIISTDETQ